MLLQSWLNTIGIVTMSTRQFCYLYCTVLSKCHAHVRRRDIPVKLMQLGPCFLSLLNYHPPLDTVLSMHNEHIAAMIPGREVSFGFCLLGVSVSAADLATSNC